jgi:hypothetical protein
VCALHAAFSSLKKISWRIFFNAEASAPKKSEALIIIAIAVTLAEA